MSHKTTLDRSPKRHFWWGDWWAMNYNIYQINGSHTLRKACIESNSKDTNLTPILCKKPSDYSLKNRGTQFVFLVNLKWKKKVHREFSISSSRDAEIYEDSRSGRYH